MYTDYAEEARQARRYAARLYRCASRELADADRAETQAAANETHAAWLRSRPELIAEGEEEYPATLDRLVATLRGYAADSRARAPRTRELARFYMASSRTYAQMAAEQQARLAAYATTEGTDQR